MKPAPSLPAAAQAGKTYYWISHGSPADPVWTYFLAGAKQWASDTGNTVNTSLHNGQVAPQQEAVRAAIGMHEQLSPTIAAALKEQAAHERAS